jgi:hypothetical protein
MSLRFGVRCLAAVWYYEIIGKVGVTASRSGPIT